MGHRSIPSTLLLLIFISSIVSPLQHHVNIGSATASAAPLTTNCTPPSQVDALLGQGNWTQLTQYEHGVTVNDLPDQGGADFFVFDPIIQIDKLNNSYLPEETAPHGGAATVWFNAPINDCPPAVDYQLPTFTAGITHISGGYRFTDQNFLLEGANEISELGADAIFVYLTQDPNNPIFNSYPANNGIAWPAAAELTSLTKVAQSAPFQNLFARSFSTFVLTTYSAAVPYPISPGNLYDDSDFAAEEEQFYDLTRHLISTYQGSNKTFILKHWEGDSIVGHQGDATADWTSQMTTEQQIELIRWLQARQAGVERARRELAQAAGVQVLHAVEVNRVVDQATNRRFINSIIPYINADMVAYSAWDSTIGTQSASQLEASLEAALQLIDSKTPDRHSLNARRMFISEFGLLERERPLTVEEAATWCEPTCNSTDFEPIIEETNGRALKYRDDSPCATLNLPGGVMIDYWTGLYDIRLSGPIRLPSICGATLRLLSRADVPPVNLEALDSTTAAAWCAPTCSQGDFSPLYESGNIFNPRGLVYEGNCTKFELPAGIQFDISYHETGTISAYSPAILDAICRATLRRSDQTAYTEQTAPLWRVASTLQTASEFGLSYGFYWQLYDNECSMENEAIATAQGASNRPVVSDCPGYWLIRPDGTPSTAQGALGPWLNPLPTRIFLPAIRSDAATPEPTIPAAAALSIATWSIWRRP